MPELGRIELEKTRNYEGDYNDVWEPLQVVRLNEILQNVGETYICVRKCNVLMTNEEARTKPLTELFWSDEIARMYPRDMANATNRVSPEREEQIRQVERGGVEIGGLLVDEVSVKIGARYRRVVPGSYLLITPDREEHKSVPHYPGRVQYLFTRSHQGKKTDYAHILWFARGENTVLGRVGDPKEWYLVEECEDVLLSSACLQSLEPPPAYISEQPHLPLQHLQRHPYAGQDTFHGCSQQSTAQPP